MLSLVVATHGGLYVIKLNSSWEIEQSILVDDGYHYGVTVDHLPGESSTLIYAYRGGPGRLDELPREIRVWKFDGDTVETVEHHGLNHQAGDIHQITRQSESQFLLTNSLFNSVDRWNPNEGLISRFHLNGLKTDINHVNSVFAVDDLLAIMLHNFRKLESEIVVLDGSKDQLSELGRFSLKDLCCHNIGILDHFLYFNASSSRAIVKIDLHNLREVGRKGFSEHTKGLCSDGNRIFAGMSDCAARAERVRSSGWLSVIHPETLEVERTIQLSEASRGNSIGNVNEIRLLNQEDFFDTAGRADKQALANSINVPQSRIAIGMRRVWITTVDRTRLLGRKLVSK